MEQITTIEQYVIDKVKQLRIQAGMSQKELSLKLGFSEGFVGNIENPRRREKYNLKHIEPLARMFNCSPKDFLPNKL